MIAWMLSRAGNNKDALTTAFAILRETDKAGWRKLSIDVKVCIADLYRPVGNLKSGVDFAKQAAQEALAARDTQRYITALSMLSYVYGNPTPGGAPVTKANLAQTIFYLELLLAKPFEQHMPLFQKVNMMGNLGTFYRKQKKYIEAENILNRAYAIAVKEKFLTLQKHDLNELMSISSDQADFKKAVAYGEKAIAVQSAANSSRPLQLNVYSRLSEAYAGAKNFEKALLYSEKARDLSDSIHNADQTKATTELDKKYQADKSLFLAANRNTLLKQQRNFILIIGLIVLISLLAAYRWFEFKKKKEALLLADQHRQLEQLDALKSKFFANISHELKTPLTLIMGPAGQLLDGNIGDAEKNNILRTIINNSKKLLNIVNELLDLGKIESGSLLLKPRPVHVLSMVKFIYQGFSSAAAYKKINYTLACDISDNLNILLDRDKFEKVANNFIGNAIKYTPAKGMVNVAVATKDDILLFSVEDDGNGIHPDDLPYIFDRYYQGRQDEFLPDAGTGIGLAIAREFAGLMGGHITVDNSWGKGSTFTAFIPLISIDNRELIQDTPGDSRSVEPGDSVSCLRNTILLVEDHEEMAAYIEAVLSPHYQITIAKDGVAALEMLGCAAILPNLIVSDVMMPAMDGFTLLNKLKIHPVYYRIPVIILTALADDKNKMRALNIGVDDYLTKPFLANELIARASNLIANATARADRPMADAGAEQVPPLVLPKDDLIGQPSAIDLVWLSQLETTVKKFIGKTDLNLVALSYEMAISERQLFRRIKSITGLTPNKYIRAIRLQIAREAIESGNYRTVAEISYMAGFDTPAYFSKLFREHFGRDVSDML